MRKTKIFGLWYMWFLFFMPYSLLVVSSFTSGFLTSPLTQIPVSLSTLLTFFSSSSRQTQVFRISHFKKWTGSSLAAAEQTKSSVNDLLILYYIYFAPKKGFVCILNLWEVYGIFQSTRNGRRLMLADRGLDSRTENNGTFHLSLTFQLYTAFQLT